MKNKCKVIAIANQKGGVGKTVTSVCLGACLAQDNKKVLIVDFDPQGSLTKGLGYRSPDSYQQSIKDLLFNEINEVDVDYRDSIIHTNEKFDLLPSNISLSGADIQLSSVMSRETVFRRVLDKIKNDYDYILIDSNPALNLFTINGLVAADSIIIPVQAEPYVIAESITFTAKHGEKIIMKDALKPETPETGDQTNMNMYIALALMSAICIAGMAISKRKRRGKLEND